MSYWIENKIQKLISTSKKKVGTQFNKKNGSYNFYIYHICNLGWQILIMFLNLFWIWSLNSFNKFSTI